MKIKDIYALEVLDSRGNPTVEVNVTLENGLSANALVPSGASTGEKEAVELRDGDKKRFRGKGVLNAVNNVNTIIAKEVVGMDVLEQRKIDLLMLELDGTPNKAHLGANAILGVSLAVAHAAAKYLNLPLFRYLGGVNASLLPTPCLNVLNGGKHADNNVDFQEFMITPHGAPNFKEAMRMASETFHALKDVLKEKGYVTAVGDEGGFAPALKSNEEAIEVILQAIERAGYRPGEDISLCLDPATSELWDDEKKMYYFWKSTKEYKSSEELLEIWKEWINKYPIVLLEDGMGEHDWEGWQLMTKELGDKVELVGDDLLCTNPKLLQEAIDKGAANSILIKLNQIGTVTETLQTIELARKYGYGYFISHRSGETEDTTIADLAVATHAGKLKTGSACRGERIAKYNRLIRIEHMLGDAARFAGIKAFKNR